MHRRLLIRPGAIGDFVVSLPALEALRGDWTEVWCGGQNASLCRFAQSAYGLAAVGLDRLGLLPADDVVQRLRSFDSIVSWYGANNTSFQEYTRDYLKLNITFLPALPGEKIHAVEFYRQQALGMGAVGVQRTPRIACPAVPRTFAAIHPFASGARKRAPLELFEAAARRLENSMPVRWLRGPEDILSGAVYVPDLYELATWLGGARVYVGNDSGIAHLAAAAGTPVVALFPGGSARTWTPRGPAVTAIQPRRWNGATAPACR